MADLVLGKGWAFPFRFGSNGRVQTTSDQSDGSTSQEGQKAHLYGAIAQIVMVAFGERLMRGTYGSGIHDVVFEPNDESLLGMQTYYAASAVELWEPRVQLLSSDVLSDKGKLQILLSYQIKLTNEIVNEIITVPVGG